MAERMKMKINSTQIRVQAGNNLKITQCPTRVKACCKSKEHYTEILGEHMGELSTRQSLLHARVAGSPTWYFSKETVVHGTRRERPGRCVE